jgi:hypothetical protein
MKNYRTPRTVAECEFTSGYALTPIRRASVGWFWPVVCLLCFAGIGVMLAWRG